MAGQRLISKFLIDTANSDAIEANVNGSVTPAVYRYTNPNSETQYIHRLRVFIEDANNLAATYGAIAALSTGVEIGVFNSAGTEVYDLLDGDDIKENIGFQQHGFDVVYSQHGSGNESVEATLSFATPLRLDSGDYFAVTVNDDLTGLTSHMFHIEGV